MQQVYLRNIIKYSFYLHFTSVHFFTLQDQAEATYYGELPFWNQAFFKTFFILEFGTIHLLGCSCSTNGNSASATPCPQLATPVARVHVDVVTVLHLSLHRATRERGGCQDAVRRVTCMERRGGKFPGAAVVFGVKTWWVVSKICSFTPAYEQ